MKSNMKKDYAKQISNLLQKYNDLTVSANTIHANGDQYVYELDGDNVIAVEKGRMIQWYQFELTHLVVHPDWRRKGLATKIRNKLVERAKAGGARILQCTVKQDNAAEILNMKKAGFTEGVTFYNPQTKNYVIVWQKSIE